MKSTKKILLGGAMLAMSAASYGQFTLSGEVRPRTEYRHGYKKLADTAQSNALFTDQRTRMNFDYKTEGYQVKLVMQDIRVWGSQPQLINNFGQLNASGAYTAIHEAWGQAFLNENWSLKMGRQEIIYDDHRIFGSVAWAQQSRAHDAFMVKYQKDGMKIDITGAYNQDKAGLSGTSAGMGSYKAFQSIWFHKKINDNLQTSILFLNNGKQVNYTDSSGGMMVDKYQDNYSQTLGTHTKYKKDKLSVAFNGYYQMGATPNVHWDLANLQRSYSGYLVGLDLGYKISDNLTAILGFEMQSGQSQTDTTADYNAVNHSFAPLYGTNHKFNGFMDYFYVGNHFNNVGLQDIYAKVKYKKEKKYIGLDLHMFSTSANVLDGYKVSQDVAAAITAGTPVADVDMYQAMSKGLGMELDLSFGMELSKGVMLKAGYSQMFGSETLAYLKGVTYSTGPDAGMGRTDQTSNWGYVMVIFKPTFIKKDLDK